jgi:IS4 transposase
MTGVQVLERKAPDLPLAPGKVQRRELEYIRHGTQVLIVNEDIAKIYSARWDIELIFKELKSRYALDVVTTTNPDIVEAYIRIAILTLLVSRRIFNIVRSLNPEKLKVRYTQLRWSTIFSENASDQLKLILQLWSRIIS